MSTKATSAHSLHLTRLIKAPREKVFRAWTDPAELKRWSAPEGYRVVLAEVDLRVGGKYRIRMRSPEGTEHTAFGTYREVTPPRKLAYTWSWEEDEHGIGETLVTVEFGDQGAATAVALTHERFPNAEARENHEQGWTGCLDRLEKLF